MMPDPHSAEPRRSDNLADQIEQICDQFDVVWKSGAEPKIEEYLGKLNGRIDTTLLRELLLVELDHRRRRGEQPSDDAYYERFPDYRDIVKDAFISASLAGTERFSGSARTKRHEVPAVSATMSARFNDLQFHAAGGLGEVFKASDESLRREVALKFIQKRYGANTDYLDLFLMEAEITSRLDHPGVVPVYGVGETFDKRPFYAMRFIAGTQLREAIDQYHKNGAERRELHRLLNRLVAVCNTVAYAHNRGVVHRDIKPENIMLGKYGETLVVDWGLAIPVERDDRARASGEKTMLVQSGSGSGKSSGGGVGTIGYMSPEQLPGNTGRITPASDIYSLGATLYRILTNKTPIQGAGETLLLDKIRWGDFPKPSEVNPKTPAALEAICLKAMATSPADRYPTALDMGADLQAWLADETVSVYQEPLTERLARWGRRNRTWVIACVLASALVLLISIASALSLSKTAARETHARNEAEQARKEAIEAREKAELAQQTGMRLAARFAAKAVANEIDRRWRILSEEATDPELPRLIEAIHDKTVGSPEQRALQQWLQNRRKVHSIESESWFVTDRNGLQLARDPYKENTIFEDFSGRTYFHGGPLNLTSDAEKKEAKPITGPHLSSVYRSAGSGSFKVACSVPIWKDPEAQRDCVGVIGMSVELGAFRELQTGLESGQIAVVIDTREDQLESTPNSGLVLHHRYLIEAQRRRLASGVVSPFRVDLKVVERLRQLRQLRSSEDGLAALASSAEQQAPIKLAGSIDTSYHDPLSSEETSAVTAAFEPVRVESRPPELRDTGWVVVVEEIPLHFNGKKDADQKASPKP